MQIKITSIFKQPHSKIYTFLFANEATQLNTKLCNSHSFSLIYKKVIAFVNYLVENKQITYHLCVPTKKLFT